MSAPRPFSLPCSCSDLTDRLIRALAIAHGVSYEVESVHWRAPVMIAPEGKSPVLEGEGGNNG